MRGTVNPALRFVMAAGVTSALVVGAVALPGPAAAAGSTDTTITPITAAQARTRPVLRLGDTGRWVRRLHRALDLHPARRPFTKRTARAVIAFRVAHGLPRKPVVNVRTWMALGSLVAPGRAPSPPASAPAVTDRPALQFGDTSGWVQAVQAALGVQPASGYFGPLTLAAVKRFQTQMGLPVTGVVDAATWAALGDRVVAPTIDATTTELARTSRSHRAALGVVAFATSWTARMVVERESGGQCDIASPGGTYRGKWQMDAAFWSAHGGTAFAPRPDLATCEQQDLVAYRGWVERWWQPWPTAIP